MTNVRSFEDWLESERSRGLVDFKVSIRPGKGATLDAVQQEIMALDAEVRANGSQPFPTPKVFLPKSVEDAINAVSL